MNKIIVALLMLSFTAFTGRVNAQLVYSTAAVANSSSNNSGGNLSGLRTIGNSTSNPYSGNDNNAGVCGNAAYLHQYASSGSTSTAAFRTFTTSANSVGGSNRTLKPGDRFLVTLYTSQTANNGGQYLPLSTGTIGISFNANTNYTATTDRNTSQVCRFELGNSGGWTIYSNGASNQFGATPSGSGSTYTLQLDITSSNTFDATLYTVYPTTFQRFTNLTFEATGPISSFCFYNVCTTNNPDVCWQNPTLSGKDVTGGIGLQGTTDASITGNITDGALTTATTTSLTALTKSGSNNITLTAGTGNNYTGSTTISAGTLTLGAANSIPNTAFTLGGGTLSTGSSTGYSNALGTLSMTGSSTIALACGTGHTLSFSGAAGSWTGTLTINGWTGTTGAGGTASGTGGKITIGGTPLTGTQLGQISFSGYTGTAIQKGDGEIVPGAVGASAPGITTTVAATGITHIAASSGGQGVTGIVTDKGLYWSKASTTTTPGAGTIGVNYDGTTTLGACATNFTSGLTNLVAQTQYYVRAYATNTNGTTYAPAVNFYTLSAPATGTSTIGTSPSNTSITLTVNTPATFPGSGATNAGYVVIYAQGATPTLASANGAVPAAGTGTIFTTASTALPATPSTSITVTGLTTSTSYSFLVVPYTFGAVAGTYNYLTGFASVVTVSTIDLTTNNDFFRSNVASGNWGTAGSWQSSHDNSVWITATSNPSAVTGAKVIIQSGHNITNNVASNSLESVTVNSGGTLTLNGADITIPSGKTFAMNGTLVCTGTNIVTGAGAFTMSNASTSILKIGNPNGITSGTTLSGSIQTTGGRTYGGESSYFEYIGTTNQNMGNGMPSVINSLTINNTGSSPNNVVSMTNTSQEIKNLNSGSTPGTLTLTNGVLKIGAGNTLNFNNNSVGTNGNIINNPNTGGSLATTGTNGADGGKVIALSGSGAQFVINGSGAIAFYDFACGTTSGTANRTVIQNNTNVTINGTLSWLDGNAAWQTNSPKYGANSTLLMGNGGSGWTANGDGNKKQWTNGGAIGTAGAVNNVTVISGCTVTISQDYAMNGLLTLGDGSTNGSLNFSGGTAGNFACTGLTINGGTFSAPGAIITLRGNFTKSGGTYTHNNGTVRFVGGTSGSPITITDNSSTDFYSLTIGNGTSTYVKLNNAVSLPASTGVLTLTSGVLETSTTNSLTLLNTAASALSGTFSSTNYINGPLKRNFPASLGSGSTYSFPVGASGNYMPFILTNPTTNASGAGTMTVTPTIGDVNASATVSAPLTAISHSEYWALAYTAAVNTVTGGIITIGKPSLGGYNYVAQSSGTNYTSLGPGGVIGGTTVVATTGITSLPTNVVLGTNSSTAISVLRTQVANGSTNVSYNLTSVKGIKQARVQAAAGSTGANWDFGTGTAGSPDFTTNWRPTLSNQTLAFNTYIPTSSATGALYHTSSGGSPGLLPTATNGNYYTFNVGTNGVGDNVMSVLETNYNPVVITGVSDATGTLFSRNVTVTTATNPAAGENVYVRYSNNSFTSSGIVQVSFTGNTGTINIPWQSGTVNFYAFSSNKSLSAISSDVTTYGQGAYSLAILNVNDNAGANYSWTPTASSGILITSTGGTLSAGATYSTFTVAGGAFAALNSATNFTGTVNVFVTGDISTETGATTLNNTGGWTTLNIQPLSGARTVSGAVSGPLFDFNGADNVTIDGLNSGGSSLTISNTSTNAAASTIRFLNEANNNTIQNANILGAGTGTGVGTIFFSTSTGTNGNVGNLITANTISAAGGNLPYNAIYSNGTNAKPNTASVTNNLISDISTIVNSTAVGILLDGSVANNNNTAWTITGNKIYQSTARTPITNGGTNQDYGIRILAGAGHTVNNNVIGFATSSATGSWTINANNFSYKMIGIELNTSTAGTASEVQGNTIGGFNIATQANTTTGAGIFNGINIAGGKVNVGQTTGNIIGGATGTGSITVTTGTNSLMTGINVSTTGTVVVTGNTIGSMSFVPGNGGVTTSFTGIQTAGTAGNITITSNLIGSQSTANSLNIGSGNNSGTYSLFGIQNTATGVVAIGGSGAGNTIRNFSSPSTSQNVSFTGISNAGSTGATTEISYNTISTINTAAGNMTGITNSAAPTTLNITNNTLTGFISSNNSTAYTLSGIGNSGASGIININSNVLNGFVSPSNQVTFGPFITNSGSSTGTININSNELGNGTTGLFSCSAVANNGVTFISNSQGTNASVLSINTNNFQGTVYASQVTATQTYISNTATTKSQAINNNTFTNINVNTTGNVTFISNGVNLISTGTMNVDGNAVVTAFTKAGAGNTVTFFSHTGTSVTGSTESISSNILTNISLTGGTNFVGINNTDGNSTTNAPVKAINSNQFGFTTTFTGSINPITVDKVVGTGSTVSSNTINLSNITTNGNAFTGITLGSTAGSTSTITVASNTITNIASTGNTVNGISSGFTGTARIGFNTIKTLSTSAGSLVTGISTSGTTASLYNNKIYDLSGSNASGTVNGILVSSGTTDSVYNNLIGDLRTPAATNGDAVRGISLTSTVGSSNIRVYFNSIYLSGSGGTNFGSSGIFHATNGTATTASLDMRNNILVNTATPNGTGITAAYRRSSNVLTNYNASSNRNLLYAGTPGASNLLYYDGTGGNNSQTICQFKTVVSARDVNSVSEVVPFVSTDPTNANFLKINTASSSQAESGGNGITGITTDFTGVAASRAASATTDIGAYEFAGLASPAVTPGGPDNVCQSATPSAITLSGAAVGGGSTQGQWSIFSGGGTLTPASGFTATPATVTYTPAANFNGTVTLRLTNNGCAAAFADRTITVNPLPTPTFVSPTTTVCANSTNIVYTTQAGMTAYSWSIAGGSITSGGTSTDNTATVTWGAAGSGSISVSYTNANGCTAEAPTSQAVTKTGAPTTSNAGPDQTSCSVTAVTLAANAPSSGTGVWSIDPSSPSVLLSQFSGGGTPLNNPAATFTPAGGQGDYILTWTISNSPCVSSASSVTITISDGYVWTQAIDNNFNNQFNWSCHSVPDDGANITVEDNTNLILPGDFEVGNITLNGDATVTIGANTLTITGLISVPGTGTFIGSSSSNLVIGGQAGDLYFGTGAGGTLYNLTLNDDAVANLASPLAIVTGSTPGTVTVGAGASLTSDGNLTLLSDGNGTARVGNSAGDIIGDVTVQRYIPQNQNRAWRLLSVPTQGGQDIFNSWQEGGDDGSNGFGTQITQSQASANNGGSTFDATTVATSILTYDPPTNQWVPVPNTDINPIETTSGYMLFIRGNRLIGPNTNPTQQQAGSTATLRTRGTLYMGSKTVNTVNGFNLIGNLYASEVEFSKLTKTGGVSATQYTVWDPKLSSGNGLGGFTTFTLATGWRASAGGTGGSYQSGVPYPFIQSGQGFFVSSAGSGSVVFNEDDKGVNSSTPFRPMSGEPLVNLTTNLYAVNNGAKNLTDGNIAVFDDAYSNTVDTYDALKVNNFGENFGLIRDNTTLAVEARSSIHNGDTLYFNMWNLKQPNYSFEFRPEGLDVSGLTAFLEDKYLGTSKPVDLTATTFIDFTVTTSIPASFANDRFRVVFRGSSTVPVSFTTLNAYEKSGKVKVEWKVSGERGIKTYDVERSVDGRNFSKSGSITATGNNGGEVNYNWLDEQPVAGVNYYRVRSNDISGQTKYTNIVKVQLGTKTPGFTVYPNPVKNGQLNLQFTGQSEGLYLIKLSNTLGQVLYTQRSRISGGNGSQSFRLPSEIASGIYQLEITAPDTTKTVQKVIIE